MGNDFGKLFSIASFGESHSLAQGVVINGCPPNIKITQDEIQKYLNERRPGQSKYVTDRKEPDKVLCLSGIENNTTLGSPICLVVYNKDARPEEYKKLKNVFRPSHGDFTTFSKYGIKSASGGGRVSARETLARVAAASVARKVLDHFIPSLRVLAYVERVKHIKFELNDASSLTREAIYESFVRCPDLKTSQKMMDLISKTKDAGDSVGGVVRCLVYNVPVGLGEPVFDKLDAELAKAMVSIPAVKGFELGKGFSSTVMKGSEHNDSFLLKDGRIGTQTNNSGGIQAGISNGEAIDFRVAFKPTSTIFKPQETVDLDGQPCLLELSKARHDPCVLPRAVPVVESMVYLTLTDYYLRNKVYQKH